MPLGIVCEPASDSIAVAPCGSVDGVGYAPTMQELAVSSDPASWADAPQLVANSLTAVISIYLVGFVVGSIIRIVRGA